MKHLLLDTCVWLNIFSIQKYFVICEKLIYLLDNDLVKVIMPQIVVDEINKHRPMLSEKFVKSSIDPLRNAKKVLKEYSDSNSIQCKSYLDECISTLTQNISYNILQGDTIDKILSHHNVINMPLIDSHYKEVVELGKEKKAPFKNKNSMSDALILCAFKDYVMQEQATCIFITENTMDFSDTTVDNRNVHPDIKEFVANNFQYSINIGDVINEILPHGIEEQVINLITNDIANKNCTKHDFQDGCWRISRYGGGLSWHQICKNCGLYFDTGELYE